MGTLKEGSAHEAVTGVNLVCYFERGTMRKIWLPGKPEGHIPFDEFNNEVFLEVRDSRWAVCSKGSYCLSKEGMFGSSLHLSPNDVVKVTGGRQQGLLFVDSCIESGEVFRNYCVTRPCSLTIGREAGSHIRYASGVVSGKHAVLEWNGATFAISDAGSKNHVYVNNRRVSNCSLQLGDVVYISGLTIIIGEGFVSLNDQRSGVSLNTPNLRLLSEAAPARTRALVPQGESVFSRQPRHRLGMACDDIEIEPPPASLGGDGVPYLLRMGSSMTMGVSSALMGHYLMMVNMLVFPLLNHKFTDAQKKEYEALRRSKYQEYLYNKAKEIHLETKRERSVLTQNYPALSDVLNYADAWEHLWERRNVDDDFLKLRLGTGSVPLLSEVVYPRKRFALDNDDLMDAMFKLAETPFRIKDAPMMVSLVENHVCGVRGSRMQVISFFRRLIAQICMLHSSDEVKIVLIANKEDFAYFESLRTLPHVWDESGTFRFMATDAAEAVVLGARLREVLDDHSEQHFRKRLSAGTYEHYCVFALDKQLADSIEVLKEVMQDGEERAFSVVAGYPSLPKDCQVLICADSWDGGKIVYLNQLEKDDDTFVLDTVSEAAIDESLKKLGNVGVVRSDSLSELPSSLSFFEMLGVGRVEHIAPLRRWRENDPTVSLASPVGVTPEGAVAYLDVHEKYQGPHGLVAGMTGSGKSEFLLTYLLGLAINYHPDEVAFVLIDYKGGGLAGAFLDEKKGIHLPHVVGTITNLDGSSIQRSLISLEAEVKRRQRVFNEAKSRANAGTMDIYAYQKLYRKGVVEEPLPHLIIVSDEFAELKQQQPEFMTQLVSIARIGRSLGVHLILATQKPAGVVNEQIRSNAKFKACLKVQSSMDSKDMLGRPEAAELKTTGRYYLQVGYNESFSLGQSGWSGAPYEPSDTVAIKKDDRIEFIDTVGQVIYEAKPKVVKKRTGKSQLVAIVEELCRVSAENGITPQMIWCPELPSRMDLTELEQTATEDVRICLGRIDDPQNQVQMPLELSLLHDGNIMLVGEAKTGKTTFVETLLLSLAQTYSPEQVQFYLLDYSSRMLRDFFDLPHCGAVLDDEETDRLAGFVTLIDEVVEERKQLFEDLGVGSFEDALKIQSLPLVLVVIDGYALFGASKEGDSLGYALPVKIKYWQTFGIRFMVTCAARNEVPTKMRAVFGKNISLYQNDKYKYFDTLGVKCPYAPPCLPGRGLIEVNEAPLEFQTAMFRMDAQIERRAALREEIAACAAHWQGYVPAKKLRSVDKDESYEAFMERFGENRIPLGYAVRDSKEVALPHAQFSMLWLYFGDRAGKAPMLENIIRGLRPEQAKVLVVTKAQGSVFVPGSKLHTLLGDSAQYYSNTFESVRELCKVLTEETVARKDVYVAFCQELVARGEQLKTRKPYLDYLYRETTRLYVLFEDYGDFCGAIPASTDPDAKTVIQSFTTYFQHARNFNYYFLGVFDAQSNLPKSHDLVKPFNPDKITLLFGGNYDKQTLLYPPREVAKFNSEGAVNKALMYYREKYYGLTMPYTPEQGDAGDEDEQSIFGD